MEEVPVDAGLTFSAPCSTAFSTPAPVLDVLAVRAEGRAPSSCCAGLAQNERQASVRK